MDPFAPLEPPAICDPTPKPGAVELSGWLVDRWGGAELGIGRACETPPRSHHEEGRALDWAPPTIDAADSAIAELLDFGAELARAYGIRNIIWQRRIWIAGKGWQLFDGSPHSDHVHISLSWAGAMGETSAYRPRRRLPAVLVGVVAGLAVAAFLWLK